MKRTGPRPENLEAWVLLSAPTGAAAAAGPIPRKIHGSTAVMRRCCRLLPSFPCVSVCGSHISTEQSTLTPLSHDS